MIINSVSFPGWAMLLKLTNLQITKLWHSFETNNLLSLSQLNGGTQTQQQYHKVYVDGKGTQWSATQTTFCVSQRKTVSVLLEPNMIRGYAYGFMCNPVWKWIMEKVWPQQYIYRLYTGWVRCHKSWLPPHRFNRYLNCTRALKQLFVVPPTQCQKWVKPFLAD